MRQKFTENPSFHTPYQSYITPNNPQFHYYISPTEADQKVTLYLSPNSDNPEIKKQIAMYYNIDNHKYEVQKIKDESILKDFSYLDYLEKQEDKIDVDIGMVERMGQKGWMSKYQPKSFVDLLSDETINRNVLTWMKSWDQIVFHKLPDRPHKVPLNPFNATATTKPKYTPQQYNNKKLILLSGPPGCGKTTLARVVAKHCKYNIEQINASDDRSGKTLIQKIDSIIKNQTIRENKRPTCIVVDEVDGVVEGEGGLKDVLKYIETGEISGGEKRKKNEYGGINVGKSNNPQNQGEKKKQSEPAKAHKLTRPIIFICNDPYVKSLKELRSKSIIVHFTTLQQQRVSRRLKDILQQQQIYIESDVVSKITKMCNNDVRSAIGVLELVGRHKLGCGVSAKDIVNKMRLSFNKDANTSINQFLSKVLQSSQKPFSQKNIFKTYQSQLFQIQNYTLLSQTFLHNILNYRHFFNKFDEVEILYKLLRNNDVNVKESFHFHGEIDWERIMPFLYYRMNFKREEVKKIQFPGLYFERINRIKSNKNILQKIQTNLPSFIKPLISQKILTEHYLYLLYQSMLTSSPKQQEIISCVSKMLSYNFRLANKSSPNIFTPQLDQLLTFGGKKLEINLSSISRNLIEQNYEFLKVKKEIIGQAVDDKRSRDILVGQMKRNKKKREQKDAVKYKYLEGSGTEIKYDIKLSYFFDKQLKV